MSADLLVASLGLTDLAEKATAREPFARADLERVLACGNPLVAASLADRARAATAGIDVTHPWTLRVRAPGLVHGLEDPTRVSHDPGPLDDVPATEMELVGELPPDAPLGLARELVLSLRALRPDLTLRAFTAAEVAALAARDGRPLADVLAVLADAGLAALSWRPGSGIDAREIDVHRAAHAAGICAPAIVGYAAVDAEFVARVTAWVACAADVGGVASAMALPRATDGASPLDGTSGTEDWAACALVRLAFGRLAGRVTSDWHVVGSKLGATLLSCGADDVVGAQAAAKWAPPTDDGPRPLNPDRARRWIVEARRSPVRRDSRFRRVEP